MEAKETQEYKQIRPEHQHIWEECLTIVKSRINTQSFKTWFEPILPVNLIGSRFVIKVPSQFFGEWLEEHYYSLINEALTKIVGAEIVIDYTVSSDEHVFSSDAEKQISMKKEFSVSQNLSPELVNLPAKITDPIILKPSATSKLNTFLNPRYKFENYIKGESNQFACAAALAVANNPGGTSFNPLVVYGGVGLGKTHLVQAIGNRIIQTGKTQNVLYVSSEKFTVDFVESIQKDSITEFSNYYRSADILIVDDIQFFTGKEKTQDFFYHTFNALHQLGKQIVLSSDKPPKELKGLNERLISRFQWGLTADIQPPDLETRIAILQKKSQDDNIELSQEVVEFIAINVTSNIRELEGCLISLLARASLENREINPDLAKDVVRSVIGEIRTHITIEEIQRVVCEQLEIPEDLIRAKTRKQEIVLARQIAMYLSKELTNSSLKTIGLHFGGRDHSTVIHAYQTIEDGLYSDNKLKNLIQQIKSKLELGMI